MARLWCGQQLNEQPFQIGACWHGQQGGGGAGWPDCNRPLGAKTEALGLDYPGGASASGVTQNPPECAGELLVVGTEAAPQFLAAFAADQDEFAGVRRVRRDRRRVVFRHRVVDGMISGHAHGRRVQHCDRGWAMILNGVAAIVTGGASGLGAATADMLARYGARVAVFDRDAERGAAKAHEVGGRFWLADVTDGASIAQAIAEAEAAHGVARVLVNCAGIGPAQKTVGRESRPHQMELFRRVIEINLIGTFNVLSLFAAALSKAAIDEEERGVVVNTASVAAFDGQVGQAAYSASKGGIVGMTLPIARDLAEHRIRVVTIAPGLFLTPLLEGLPQDVQDSLGRQVPFPPRLGRPSEFAQMVEAIIANPMLNGETIRLDGAIRMAPR